MKLLTTKNHKIVKGEKLGYLTGILHLAPGSISGYEVCPKRSSGCTHSCLFMSGMGVFSTVQAARIKKTKEFFENRTVFLEQLKKDIEALKKKADKLQMKTAVRLNGTSDIEWTRFGIMEEFPDIQFYDYTKVPNRLTKANPSNYYLTFSLSENNLTESMAMLKLGWNVAAVFRNDIPSEWNGYQVINGDESDVRFLDPQGVVVGLKAKGKAKKDKTGFVIDLNLKP
jgi:hypothetical protein